MLVPAILGSDPRVGVQEDNNRFAVLLDLAGDLTEVDVSEILAGAEFAAPLETDLCRCRSSISELLRVHSLKVALHPCLDLITPQRFVSRAG